MSWLPLGCFFSLSLLLIHCGTPGFPLPRLSVNNITLYLKHNPLLLLPLLYFFYFIIEHLQHFDNIIIRARVLAVTADLCHPGQPCFLSSPLYQPFSPFFTFFHLFTFLSLQFLICIYCLYTLTLLQSTLSTQFFPSLIHFSANGFAEVASLEVYRETKLRETLPF